MTKYQEKKMMLFLIATIQLFSCLTASGKMRSNRGGAKDTLGLTTITVNIEGNRKASFYFNSRYSDNTPPCFLTSKDKTKSIDIEEPTLLIDSYHQIPFLVYPGEKLFLTVDEAGLPVFSKEKDQLRNNELRFFLNYYKRFNINKRSELFMRSNAFSIYDKKYSFDLEIERAKTDSAKRFQFLRDYRVKVKITDEFASYAYNTFKYLYILNVLKPLSMVSITKKDLPIKYLKYVDSLSTLLTCDSCMGAEAYQRVCSSMMNYMTNTVAHNQNQFSLSYDIISSHFASITRRYMLFLLLKKNMPLAPLDYEQRFNAFLTEKSDEYSGYLNKQRDLVNKFKLETNDKMVLANSDGIKLSWSQLLKKYAGYTMYVDFWASWCAPCRQNMPLSHQLAKRFKEKKIVFVYISIDDNPSSWQKAALEEGLDKKNSFLLLDQKNSSLKKRFNITSIPRYFIVGANGIVVNDKAAYPNDKQIESILGAYLK